MGFTRGFIIFVGILGLAVLALFFGGRFFGLAGIFEEKLRAPAEILKEVAEPVSQREVISPIPLRVEREVVPEAVLTREGVISLTNIQRAAEGLALLAENSKLNSAAQAKVKDMFANQYFAHVSPRGTDAGTLAANVNYEFIRIGENLAMGNFANDQELIRGWMDSPGHRANILNTGFDEIGVAVEKGLFEGKPVWLAVQIFGLPSSACPQPDVSLKANIEGYDAELGELRQRIETLKKEIEEERNKTRKQYNEMVEQYNALVLQYNGLVDELKTLIDSYNAQVRERNLCIERKLK